ncbi:hypothetical protein LSM04_007547 [Trypanosoma melophagium]|uniref:uncharacterized protein n=1 Tax=Trypanosoma melophagium TaxID=715481 RepID=UPI00351A16FD|nr:hypothetical protein LSM04_007547 [Trypanosoma melophagium]
MVTSLSADQWTVPPPFSSRNQTGIRDMSGEADRGAIIIFSVFTILLLLSVCFCVFFHRRQKPEISDGFSKPHKGYSKPEYQYKKSSSSIELDTPELPHREQVGYHNVHHLFSR